MGIETSIERTISRHNDVSLFSFGGWAKKLYAGLSKEFGRLSEYKDKVLSATVVSDKTTSDAFDDLEQKYGLKYPAGFTTDQRKNMLKEKASLFGSGGPEWLELQIQMSGFPFYVIENNAQIVEDTQYGTETEYGYSSQYAIQPKRLDPSTVSGILITSSPNKRGGRVVAPSSQYGINNQYGSTVYGTADTSFTYPQPASRQLPTNPQSWGRVFFLSPFPDRIASDSEMPFLTNEEFIYLRSLIHQSKFLRNWCILQAWTDITFLSVDGTDGVITEDESSIIIV